jgi:small-conductance mechanosensitive channel
MLTFPVLANDSSIANNQNYLLSFILGIYDFLYSIWNYPLFSMDSQPIALSNLIIGIILFIIGLRVAKYLSLLIRNKLLRVLTIDPTVSYALGKISHYFFIIIITLIVLDISNIPITVFALVGGALAISIGAGGQHVVNNFLSGLVLMIEAPIKVGDLIEIDPNTRGWVKSIDSRCVNLKTQSNTNILIPHSALLQQKFTNLTFKDHIIRAEAYVKVMPSNLSALEVSELLIEKIKYCPDILESPMPEALLLGFEDNALSFEIQFWVDISSVDRRRVISDINHIIDQTLTENGISLAIPYRRVLK